MKKCADKDMGKKLADGALAVIVLNVGDGDGIIVRFPTKYGSRACAVIDSYNSGKTIAALEALNPEVIPFICATHPHFDHNAGLAKVIKWCIDNGIKVKAFWDSGFRHVSKTHYDLIRLLQSNPDIDYICPTSGFEMVYNMVRITVLSPSIQLKNRYDTFGTSINNASIVMKLEYPPKDVAPYYAPDDEISDMVLSENEKVNQHKVILGADAQFDAWARITAEFPHLVKTKNRGQMLNVTEISHRPLSSAVLKVPHHMSKHGIALEVLETIGARYTLASCSDESKHGFPHEITVMSVQDIQKKKQGDGIFYTGHPDKNKRSGTIVAVFNEGSKSPVICELGEAVSDNAPL